MPELPDVEIFRRYFQSTALHQPVAAVQVPSPKLLRDLSASRLGRKLHGRTFVATSRHGKYLLAEVPGKGHLVLHFGMTGFLKYHRRAEAGPVHAALILEFDNGYRLVFDCQRKFGEIRWHRSVAELRQAKELGPDPLRDGFEGKDFRRILRRRRGAIKSLLMNQQALAGIGNVYSDEILFQAGMHPRRPVSDLDEDEIRQLYGRVGSVLQQAIDCRVGEKGWPKGWLLPRREAGETCPRCGGTIERLKISGRHAYCCPEHQT